MPPGPKLRARPILRERPLTMSLTRRLFPGFEPVRIDLGEVVLAGLVGGEGPPLVMLHGYPQNLASWHRVAGAFTARFRCHLFDLRGYGESSVPTPADDGSTYSKRAMAADVVAAMARLGHRRFALLGHDRGARAGYRMALDHPDTVSRLGIVEIVPTADMWAAFDAGMAMKAYHWTFLAQPHPLPERLIAADPAFYLDRTLASWSRSGTLDGFDPLALECYRAGFRDPARVRAFCEDYRAGATIDRALDEQDLAAGRRIGCPVHFVWGDVGFPSRAGDPLALWRRWADVVTGERIEAGHFAQEENPDAVARSFAGFFAG